MTNSSVEEMAQNLSSKYSSQTQVGEVHSMSVGWRCSAAKGLIIPNTAVAHGKGGENLSRRRWISPCGGIEM